MSANLVHSSGARCSMTELLASHALEFPDKPALVFVGPGQPDQTMTYGELEQAVIATARGLIERGLSGRAVGLHMPAGLDFVVALLACFAASAVAAPIAPIGRRKQRQAGVTEILHDCQAAAVIVGSSAAQEAQDLAWVAAEGIPVLEPRELSSASVATWPEPPPPNALAVLQYTSGSTSNPKGVMLSHAAVMANQAMIKSAFEHDSRSDFVGWAPHFHDQGLFGNILQPLYLGASCVLMSPAAFLRQPLFWLETIGRFRAHTSGGPNFAYELCIEHLRRHGGFQADLSSWRKAFNGAEPIRASTMRAFAAAFEPYGFDPEAVLPCYGLAECTLFTSGRARHAQQMSVSFDATALSEGRVIEAAPGARATEIVSCGPPAEGAEFLVVEPGGARPLQPAQLGEIWIAGPHIAEGYWRRPEDTAETFVTDPTTGRRYLRTGDLGFMWQGELFIADRLKDLIIVRGRNVYPHDVEAICVEASDALAPTAAAAVAIETASGQAICLIAEARRSARRDLDVVSIAKKLKEALILDLGVSLDALVVIPPGAMPKTTSGKLQRRRIRLLLLDGELPVQASLGLPANLHPQKHAEPAGLERAQ